MKQSGFIIFFAIVLTIYSFFNWYILSRGLIALPGAGIYRTLFVVLSLLLILSYPVGRIMERTVNRTLSEFFIHIGAYYLAVMVFAFFLILCIDFLRLGNHFLHFYPQAWLKPESRIKPVLFWLVISFSFILTAAGAWNARQVRIRNLALQIDKRVDWLPELNIVIASDFHLGNIIHNSRLEKIVAGINALQPDVILLPGDIFDEDITTLIEKNTAGILARFKSKYGVYAVPGNHEYYSGIDRAIGYLQQAHITVLRDSAAFVANSFYLIGRDDPTGKRFGGKREKLANLMQGIDQKYPSILLDHQPFHLEEAQENGVDLQLSGHTHHGQFFPFNLITNRVYEKSWGYLKKGNTHYYISCGVGTWGPPVRLGNRPEIVRIRLQFGEK